MDHQQKLKYYKLLIDMVKKTSSTMESDSVLQYILDGIIEVLPCVEVGVLFIYDEEEDLLKMVATHNITFDDEHPYLKPGDSVSGKCFMNRDCIALNTTETFVNYMDRTTAYMKSFPDANIDYPYSAMSCCLIADNRAVGVVIVYNYADKDYFFTNDDLALLQAASDHAAITISKHQLIKQLEESNKALVTTVDVQNHFMDIILNSNGFANILKYLEKAIPGEAVLYDVLFQEIYRTNTSDDRLFQDIIDTIDLKNIFDVKSNQHLENIMYTADNKTTIINPIIVQKSLVGFLILMLKDRTLSKKDEAILNHASLVLALEWSKNDSRTRSFSDISNKFLDYLLTSPVDADAIKYAKKLGLDHGNDFCLSIIKSKGGNAQEEIIKNLYISNIIDIIKHMPKINGIIFPREDDIYIIYYCDRAAEQKITYIAHIEDQILKLMPEIKILRGGVYNSLENIKKSYDDAQYCLKMSNEYDLPMRKIDYDSLGIWKLLLRLEKNELEEYAYGVLKGLLSKKTEKNQELLATLGLFIKNNKSISETAKAMNLHNNSIYFRLKKVEEILGLSLADDNDWLNIQLSHCIISKCDKK